MVKWGEYIDAKIVAKATAEKLAKELGGYTQADASNKYVVVKNGKYLQTEGISYTNATELFGLIAHEDVNSVKSALDDANIDYTFKREGRDAQFGLNLYINPKDVDKWNKIATTLENKGGDIHTESKWIKAKDLLNESKQVLSESPTLRSVPFKESDLRSELMTAKHGKLDEADKSYQGGKNSIRVKGFDPRYADSSALNILHKIAQMPELQVFKDGIDVEISVK